MTLRCLDVCRSTGRRMRSTSCSSTTRRSTASRRSSSEMPAVRHRAHTQHRLAGGCNLALRDLDDVDYVALLNNDAVPDRTWLRPLVETLEGDATIGAACSKMVFAPSFVALTIDCPGLFHDSDLGVRISGLTVDGSDVWDHTQFADGAIVARPGAPATSPSAGRRRARRCGYPSSRGLNAPMPRSRSSCRPTPTSWCAWMPAAPPWR